MTLFCDLTRQLPIAAEESTLTEGREAIRLLDSSGILGFFDKLPSTNKRWLSQRKAILGNDPPAALQLHYKEAQTSGWTA
jgi:hypothetical protein